MPTHMAKKATPIDTSGFNMVHANNTLKRAFNYLVSFPKDISTGIENSGLVRLIRNFGAFFCQKLDLSTTTQSRARN